MQEMETRLADNPEDRQADSNTDNHPRADHGDCVAISAFLKSRKIDAPGKGLHAAGGYWLITLWHAASRCTRVYTRTDDRSAERA